MQKLNLPMDVNGDYNLGEWGTPCLISNTDEGKKLISNDPEINNSFAVFMMYLRKIIANDRRYIIKTAKELFIIFEKLSLMTVAVFISVEKE